MAPFAHRQQELMDLIAGEMEAGTDASDPRVQELVDIWRESMQSVAGEHQVSRDTLAQSILQSSHLVPEDAPKRDVVLYLGRALAAAHN